MSDGPLSYEPFFGLKKKPFSLASDPEFLYESPSHAAALLSLLAGIRRREGLLAFTGDVGTGKTTICRAVLRNLDRTTFSAFIPDPFASREDLLRMLLVDFGVSSVQDITTGPLAQAGRAQLSYLLSSFLETLVPLDAFVVVFIDEAQNMSLSLLEEVRVLSDAFNRYGQLQMVFAGQLELLDKLKSPTMRQVDQRVSVYTRLDPLTPEDVVGYVHHRLQIAGASPHLPMFAPMALTLLHEASGGIPRVINRLCDRALHLAWERRSPLIDRALIEEALGAAPAAPLPVPASTIPVAPLRSETRADEKLARTEEDAAAVPVRLAAESPAVFAHRVDEWLSHLDGHTSPEPLAEESFESFASENDVAAPEPPPPIEAPRRRYKPQRYIERLGRRWARAAAIAVVVLLALNAAVAAASYVPQQLTQRIQAKDLPPVPAPPRLALRPIVLPTADPEAPQTGTQMLGEKADGHYVVAVGAYTSSARAGRLVQSLASKGFRAYARTLALRDRILHQVWLGPFTALSGAQQELDRLRTAGDFGDARVLPLRRSSDQAP
jgi:type II secretory pathway predicted ATPase ExeA/cell division septation protein DedD